MRTRFTSRLVAASLAGLSFVGVGATVAQASPSQLSTSNIYNMGATIEGLLDGQVAGYGYAITKNGQLVDSGAGGKARAGNGDEANVDFKPTTRVEIASATKNITAAAILKLLEANNLSVDTKVNGYFPFNWTRGAGWEDVTFRMLLSHTSGLEQQGDVVGQGGQWNTLWNGVQFAVGQPITAGSPRDYSNMNYAALRVLMARLWKIAEPDNGQPSLNSTNSGQIALAYVNKNLLNPAGITGINCGSDSFDALIYEGPKPTRTGRDASLKGADLEACAGHRGLNMSAIDMVRFQAHLRHGNIVSPSVRALMDNDSNHAFGELGWAQQSNNGGWAGRYWHGGDITVGGQGVHTCQAKFPGGIEAAVIVNSESSNNDMCQILRAGYNAI